LEEAAVRTLLNQIDECRRAEITLAQNSIAQTSITSRINEDLEYALKTKSFVVIEGLERLGKSVTAQNFCARHAGEAVYIRLESGNDETSFFRTIAKALGTTFTAQRKGVEMRLRIEDMLQGGHLMLVLDEAHFLWPQSYRANRAPLRIDWVRTALIDYQVPVALISTPQFDRQCEHFEKKVRWNYRQIKGRVALHTVLPTTLPEEDLTNIAKYLMPEADKATLLRLVGFAQVSDDYVAGIERIVKRARYMSTQHRDKLSVAQAVKMAVNEVMQPKQN
jgi:hypothetical protein